MHTLSIALLLPALALVHAQTSFCDKQGKFKKSDGAKVSSKSDISVEACKDTCANDPHCHSVSYDSDDECVTYPVSIGIKSFYEDKTGKYRVWDRACKDIMDRQAPGAFCTVTLVPPQAPKSNCAVQPNTPLKDVLDDPKLFDSKTASLHCNEAGHLKHDEEVMSDDMDDEVACAQSCLIRSECKSYSYRYKDDKVHCKAFSKTIDEQGFEKDGDAQHIYYDRNCPVTAIRKAPKAPEGPEAPAPPTRPASSFICNKRGHVVDEDAALRGQFDIPPMTDGMTKTHCRDSCIQNTTCQAFGFGETPQNKEGRAAICFHLPHPLNETIFKADRSAPYSWTDRGCRKQ